MSCLILTNERIGISQRPVMFAGFSAFSASAVQLNQISVSQISEKIMACLLSRQQQATESFTNDKKMLIDAHQPEETRVVLLNGNKIEEFDYENNSLAQLKGNVYLARVTRVEPSLQAAFVEYGGNRQGFLAFSEIHPDYYRIPVEDREALEADSEVSSSAEAQESAAADAEPSEENEDTSSSNNAPEELGGDDEHDDSSQSSESMMRRYKIQEVITRKQILLVQVVKEERGNKGAALTTYLSLAGRYCVLMPNSNRGGGVSRKITNVADRKRLKSVVSDLDIPKGMAVIVRTAGSKRTKTEIKRDYAYLSKLWNEIRSKTLQSEAPALIHEEGSLVKRAVRDMYTNDVEEVLIEGDDSYKVAKAQMKMLIPSHAKSGHKVRRNRTSVSELWDRTTAGYHSSRRGHLKIRRISGHQPDRSFGCD